MSLEYALVTSSSLPDQVKESVQYVAVDKPQWLDLVDYSQDIVSEDPEQEILFLIVAKGTAAQEKADAEREATRQARIGELEARETRLDDKEQTELAEAKAESERLQSEDARKRSLRDKSKSIFNALYNR